MDAEYVRAYARQQVEIELDEQKMRERVDRIVSLRVDQILAEIIEQEFSVGIKAMVRSELRSGTEGIGESDR